MEEEIMSDLIKVSVIVPIYNVEEYLRQCLDSLADQTLKEIEVLMVNDGSTDSSGEIASEYADRYDNFQLLNKPNGGLSQARNYAIPLVKGEYLAFFDSDDYVSIDAYEKLYDMSDNGLRDLIIGNVKRFNSKKTYNSSLHKNVFKDNINDTNIVNNPELIYDTTAWNKLFKVEFWKENDFKFPEGVLYEDIPVTLPAHFKSKSTAVLTDVIYYWRVREGVNKSITQERTNINNFKDRLNALKIVDKYIEENVIDEDVIYYKYFKWLDLDLKLYINVLDQVDEEYLNYFIPVVQEYLKTFPEYIFGDIRAIDRIKYYFIQIGDVDSILETIKFEKNKMRYLEVVWEGDKYFGKFPFKNIPREYFEMTREYNKGYIARKVKKIEISKETLQINGYFYIPRVNLKKMSDVNFQAKLVNITNTRELEVDIKKVISPDLTQKFGVRAHDYKLKNRLYIYDWGGYEINIDLNDLKFLELEPDEYKLVVNLRLQGIDRDVFVGSPNGSPRKKPCILNNNTIVFKYNGVGDLCFFVTENHSMVTDTYFKDENLYIEGWFDDKTLNNQLMIIEPEESIKIPISTKSNNNIKLNHRIINKFPNAEGFTSVIPIELIMNLKTEKWLLKHCRNEQLENISGNIDIKKIFDSNLIGLKISLAADILLTNIELETYLKASNWKNDDLLLSIYLNKRILKDNQKILSSKLRCVSKKQGTTIYAEKVDKKEDEHTLNNKFIIKTKDKDGNNIFHRDVWEIYVDYNIGSDILSHKIRVIDNKDFKNKVFKTHKYNLTTYGGFLGLKVALIWRIEARSARKREALERFIYLLMRFLPINKRRIIFDSYWTNKYICNPRYLYEYIDKNYPEYECIWTFFDESIKINGNGKKTRFRSLKYFYYMATAKYFVNNVNFPDFYKKRKNAVEIQTMHGTPLKTIGLDVEEDFKTEESIDKFVERCKRWDYLIVSSDKVADIAKRCFLFENEFLKVGYPRIDEIFRLNTSETAAKIKEELKIPENKKVILYAPTWRVKNKFDMMLDLEKMKDVLSKDHVLLMRLHPFSIKGFNMELLNDFVIDVSGYESIEKLYVISDVLITDYSSVMFDYGVLNKPMIFFAYDLNEYKNNLRNFNLDFEKEAPGPIVSTSDEVIDEIINMDTIKSRYSYNISEFNKKYCQYENGNSCKRIFETVFKKPSRLNK